MNPGGGRASTPRSTIDPRLAATIMAVGRAMAGARAPWWIIGSAAVALHGADAGRVADIDVLLDLSDARHILPTLGVAARPGPAHADFRSTVFGTWHGAPLPVEFMAGFHHRSGADWIAVEPVTRQTVVVAGMTVPVPERQELRRLLHTFGRPKDIARLTELDRPA